MSEVGILYKNGRYAEAKEHLNSLMLSQVNNFGHALQNSGVESGGNENLLPSILRDVDPVILLLLLG